MYGATVTKRWFRGPTCQQTYDFFYYQVREKPFILDYEFEKAIAYRRMTNWTKDDDQYPNYDIVKL